MKKNKHWATVDGEQFYTENDAKNHAKTLDDKTVTPPGEQVADIEVKGEEILGGSADKTTAATTNTASKKTIAAKPKAKVAAKPAAKKKVAVAKPETAPATSEKTETSTETK